MSSPTARKVVLITLGVFAVLLLYVLQSWTDAEPPSPKPPDAAEESPPRVSVPPPGPTGASDAVPTEKPTRPGAPPPTTPVASDTHSANPQAQAPVVGMRIRGRVVDERTDEAVPALTVSLACERRSERVLTDPQGSFETLEAFPRGHLVVEFSDLGSVLQKLEVDFDPDLASDLGVLGVRIGPTVPLLVEPADAVPCKARLVERARPSGIAGIIEVRATGLQSGTLLEGTGDREWPWIQVRAGQPPWLRYPKPLSDPDERRPPRVEVRMCGTSSEGVGAIRSTVGVQPHARVVASERYASVSGSFLFSLDDMFQTGPAESSSHGDETSAAVLLLPKAGDEKGDQASPIWHERRLDSKGEFLFERVRPGSWQLLAHATNNRIVRQDLEVLPGPTALPPIQMVRAEKEAYFDADWNLVDRDPSPSCIRLRLSAAGSFAKAWLDHGTTSFFDLPAAEFEMSVIGLHGSPPFKPFLARVSTPPGNLDLKEVGPSDESDFEFDVRDARTDQPLGGFRVAFGPRGSVFGLPSGDPSGGWRIATDAPFTWSVWCEAYAPAFGDHQDFQVGEETRIARCALTPGWGASLLFRAADPGTFQSDSWPWSSFTFPGADSLVGSIACPPLRGVRVDIGSDTMATSDDEGEARLQLREMPARLTLRCDGWKLVGVQPSWNWRIPQYVVWMDRE